MEQWDDSINLKGLVGYLLITGLVRDTFAIPSQEIAWRCVIIQRSLLALIGKPCRRCTLKLRIKGIGLILDNHEILVVMKVLRHLP